MRTEPAGSRAADGGAGRIANIALLVASLAIVIAAAEVACRTLVDTGREYHIEMWKYAVRLKRIAADPALGHEHVPSRAMRLMGADVVINSQGLRNAELGPKAPGTVRILMLGDSIAFGWGVAQDETMSAVVARILPGVEVVNSGVGNYNTAMEVAYFRDKGLALDPDVVVLNYFINDAEPTPVYRDVPWIARHAYLYPVIGGAWDAVRRRALGAPDWRAYYLGLYADDAPGWREARAAFAALATLCRERGIRLVIANIPELRVLTGYPFAGVNDRLEALARAAGVPYLDLLPSLAGENPADLWVTAPDPHPNARAHRLMGEALAAFLIGHGIVAGDRSPPLPKE
jgi:lysophospholipase L1-like esterase